ncbi:hypothetical protein LQW54_006227 [Pestalotiopsis sp. IQ-011]
MTSVMASVTSSAAISLPNNNRMSPSSTGDSPLSMGGTSSSGRAFPLPNRDIFTVEIPPLSVGANANGSSLKSPNSAKAARTTNFSRDGILGSAQKARNMSQSSEARPEQMTIELQKVSSDENMNPLKRRNTDATVDYPQPGIKLDAGDKLILERLNRIESLLQMSIVNNPNGIHISENSPPISNGTGLTGDNLLANANGNFVSMIPSSGLGTWTNQPPSSISTMPKVHTNAALHLLQWPLIRDLIQRPYDPQILLQLEMAREPLPSLAKTPCVDLSNTHAYIEAYFDRVNVWYACVNPYTWRSHYRSALSNGFREGPESCIVLLVLALGQASLRGSISRIVPQEDPPGLQYFTAAWSLLPGMMTSNSVLAAQCHLLAAAYLFYLVRPLEAWNLLCTTSSKLQLLLMTPTRIPEDQRELSERIYWNALLFESDLLAELDLPHSGVVQLEEHVGLPGGFQGEESEAVGRDDLWYFLAEIALRRLLNRVSQLIYSKDSMASTTSLEPVVAELDFQLTQWPYILAVLDNEQAVLDPAVRDSCHKCLEASIRQLEHIGAHLAGHMPYLWQGALSIVSQTLLVMGATMSPSLSSILLTLVPHREVIDQIINDVIMDIERMSLLAPSLSLAAEIIKEAEVRRRTFLSG